jgi:hypothetical protein
MGLPFNDFENVYIERLRPSSVIPVRLPSLYTSKPGWPIGESLMEYAFSKGYFEGE